MSNNNYTKDDAATKALIGGGAAVGGAIGSAVPIVGTAIGAAVGGGIGAVIAFVKNVSK